MLVGEADEPAEVRRHVVEEFVSTLIGYIGKVVLVVDDLGKETALGHQTLQLDFDIIDLLADLVAPFRTGRRSPLGVQ